MISVNFDIPDVAHLLDRRESLAWDTIPGGGSPVDECFWNRSVVRLQLLGKYSQCIQGRLVHWIADRVACSADYNTGGRCADSPAASCDHRPRMTKELRTGSPGCRLNRRHPI